MDKPIDPADPLAEYQRAVSTYTAAGAQETVQRVVTAMSRLSRRLDLFYNRQLEELGVTHGEWTVLSALAKASASTPSKLADLAGVSPSTMTHRLDRMVGRGLVVRTVDPANRTRMKIALADAGWELFRHAILDAEVVEKDILSSLDVAERRQLASLLEKLVAGLRS